MLYMLLSPTCCSSNGSTSLCHLYNSDTHGRASHALASSTMSNFSALGITNCYDAIMACDFFNDGNTNINYQAILAYLA